MLGGQIGAQAIERSRLPAVRIVGDRQRAGRRRRCHDPCVDTRDSRIWHDDPQVWRYLLRRYLVAFALLNLAWELAQLPLYTLPFEAPVAYVMYAVVHCTLGDVLIGAGAFLAALIVNRARTFAQWRWRQIGATTIALGLAYTAASEWINVALRMNWAYSAWMPVTPIVPIGASPLLQWIVVPMAALAWSRRATRSPTDRTTRSGQR